MFLFGNQNNVTNVYIFRNIHCILEKVSRCDIRNWGVSFSTLEFLAWVELCLMFLFYFLFSSICFSSDL